MNSDDHYFQATFAVYEGPQAYTAGGGGGGGGGQIQGPQVAVAHSDLEDRMRTLTVPTFSGTNDEDMVLFIPSVFIKHTIPRAVSHSIAGLR